MRKAQLRHPGCGVRLIAQAVPSLLGRGAVVAQSIGLDDEGEAGPVKIDLEPVDPLFRQRQRQPRLLGQRQKAPFQLISRQPERAPVEHRAQRPDARLAAMRFERSAQRGRVDQIKPICLVDGSLDQTALPGRGKIYQGPNDPGHRDALVFGDIAIRQRRAAVDPQTGTPPRRCRSHGDLDALSLALHPPERRSAAVTEHRARSAGKHGSHPLPILPEARSSHRKDPTSDRMQATRGNPMIDRVTAEPKVDQLPPRDHPMLGIRQLPSTTPVHTSRSMH